MYVFFEHHRDADGTVLATDVVCTSYGNSPGINWKKDKVIFEVIKGLLKSPRVETRTFDDTTKIWTYLGTSGFSLLQILQETFAKLPNVILEFREVRDLEDAIKSGVISENRQKKIDPKDFFYNKAPISQEITKKQALARMTPLMGTEPAAFAALDSTGQKNVYRRAALKLHPDRNGGDGSKMSELNMLWRVYNENPA